MYRMTLLCLPLIAAAITGCQSSNDPRPMPLYDDTELDSGMVQRYFINRMSTVQHWDGYPNQTCAM